MKTAMRNKMRLKKVFGIAAMCLGLNATINAQCSAGFIYTLGSSGVVNFTNTSTVTMGTPTYSWYFGNGTTSNAVSPTDTFQYNGTYNVTLFLNTGSCVDSISQSVTVTNGLTCNIVPSFSYSAGSNGQINFTNTSTNLPTGALYYWGFGDGYSSNLVSPSHEYSLNGSYVAQLSIYNANLTCHSAINQTVTVSNAAICNLSVNYTYTLGSNGQVNFTNSSTGTDSSLNPNWNFGDGTSSTIQSPSHVYTYNGTYYVNLHLGDSLTTCYGSHQDTITITNAPTAPVCNAYFIDSVQANGTVNFTNLSSGTTTNTTYYWTFGNGDTSTLANPSATYTANGVYITYLQINDLTTGCSSTSFDSVFITNLVPSCVPSVSFYMINQDSIAPGTWGIIPNYSSQVTGAMWYWGDGTSTPGLYPSHPYATAGEYNICVRVWSSCGDSAYVCQNDSLFRSTSMIQVNVINTTAGIKTNTQETAQVSIYPNPSNGLFTLQLNNVSAAASKAQISITNVLGDVIYTSQEQITNNVLAKNIDMQNTPNGAYFMKVTIGDKTFTNKTIINK
jgi:PKD repeat protein